MNKEEVIKILENNPDHVFKESDLPSGFFRVGRASGELNISNEVFYIYTYLEDHRNFSLMASTIPQVINYYDVDENGVGFYGRDCNTYIYLGTLEELIDFTRKEGDVVLGSSCIYIYDDYIE